MSDESGKPSSFATPRATVRTSGWLTCGACGHRVRPSDVDVRDGDAVEFSLSADSAVALFGATAGAAVSRDEKSPPQLGGIFVHDDGGYFAAASCDRTCMVHRRTAIAGAERLPANGATHGILVPQRARHEIFALLRKAGGTLTVGGGTIAARTATTTFASKLLDFIFPNIGRMIPPVPAATIEVDVDPLLKALARLVAASHAIDSSLALAGLRWDAAEDPSVATLELVREPDVAADTIAATVTGSAAVALQAARLGELLDALALKRVKISASTPVRIDGDGSLLALMATAAWPQAEAA
jgi:hypothetical protein